MARDFCLSIEQGFREHPKVKKFCRLMGSPLAFGHLIALWEWASNHAADGDLSQIDIPEIEDAAAYPQADGRCYEALCVCGFIDDRVQIHGWMEPGRTGYALAAREKERARWRKAKGIPDRTTEPRAESTEIPAGIPEESPGITRETAVVPSSSRFTVHGSDPECVSDPLKAPDSDACAHVEPARVTGHDLQRWFGLARAAVFPDTLSWVTPRSVEGKAESFAAGIPPDAIPDIRPTMQLAMERIRDGHAEWRLSEMADPSFAFGTWMSRFTALRESLHACAPAVHRDRRTQPRPQTVSYKPL